MKTNTSIRLLKFLLGSIFTGVIFYYLLVYFTCSRELSNNTPINYTLKEKTEHKGRGSSYSMTVLFRQELYTVNITSRSYEDADEGKLPILFYNSTLNIVFEKWKVTQAKRIIGAALIMLLGIAFLIKRRKTTTANIIEPFPPPLFY